MSRTGSLKDYPLTGSSCGHRRFAQAQATDSCLSLSQYPNVSTYNLLIYNGWDMYCRNFNASVGHIFCSPPTCNTYTWQANDTCDAVALANPFITLTQFMSWNPNFDPLCHNAGNSDGYQVCLRCESSTASKRSYTITDQKLLQSSGW
jgi:hypothetical protein